MADVSPLSGITGLSFDSHIPSPVVFLSSSLAVSGLSFFCEWSILLNCFKKLLQHFSLRDRLLCITVVEQLGDDIW